LEGVLSVALLLLFGCKEKDPIYPAPQSAPTPGYPMLPPGPPLQPAGAPAATPAAASAPLPPAAFGFFCTNDNDPQCPYGHCVNGRCGGCTGASQCKANAQCFPTWFGAACLPAANATPAPAGPPPASTVAGPTPAATPAPAAAPPPPPPAPAGANQVDAARARCLTRLNEYRARVGAAPLAARADAERCADSQAQSDAGSRTAHGAFGQCREIAQNECPAWSGSLDEVVDRCLAMMFAEGPGGGHYVNITDRNARGVACGVFTGSGGEIWMVQDFFR
ncbi:MAG TPA: CAP domain-containing protein, partial [Polyangiaceae bacterium]|nr:CAP domain-containing protein [Polyangiaceae bacterium]